MSDELLLMMHVKMSDERHVPELLMMYVIYRYPSDYPRQWVVRRWAVAPTGPLPGEEAVFDSLEAARATCPPGLFRLERHAQDESQIYEIWV